MVSLLPFLLAETGISGSDLDSAGYRKGKVGCAGSQLTIDCSRRR
jgi:hypothetical protein